MRRVEVTVAEVKAGRPTSARDLVVTGHDLDTAEWVTFAGDRLMLEEFADRASAHRRDDPSGTLEINVGDGDIISVEPTSGEWDSPGTSPEDS